MLGTDNIQKLTSLAWTQWFKAMERSRRLGKAKIHSIPITGLSIFIAEQKPQLEAEHPELLKLGIFAFLSQQWERLDIATRTVREEGGLFKTKPISPRTSREEENDHRYIRVEGITLFCFHQKTAGSIEIDTP
jgi:hypothetical protein